MSDVAVISELLPAPAGRDLVGFLTAARALDASDVHLAAGAVPFARIEGEVRRFDAPPLSREEADAVAAELRRRAGADHGTDPRAGAGDGTGAGTSTITADTNDLDVCVDVDDLGRFRVNLHRARRGAAASMKCIPREVRDLAALGLPETLYDLTDLRVGLVLVTGPSNSGKSSTLAALLQRVNETRMDHVITIEDPIEIVFRSQGCNVTQREVGPHTRTFSSALRAALREDPDVILVSELRDLETIRTAIVAAETGHLVLGTLHTVDAASTLNRILDVFPAREQPQVRAMLSGSLRAVVSQRLIPRQGGGRRVPAYEILRDTPAVATMLREGRTHQLASALQTGRRHGMLDLDTRLAELVAQGLVARDVARDHAKDPTRFGGRVA